MSVAEVVGLCLGATLIVAEVAARIYFARRRREELQRIKEIALRHVSERLPSRAAPPKGDR